MGPSASGDREAEPHEPGAPGGSAELAGSGSDSRAASSGADGGSGASSALPFAVAIFTSAYLLFQVQPMIARFILPWFGGSPGVWTVCMMFFQLFLLAGYLYAHLIARWLVPRRQVQLHLCLLVVSLLWLPIAPSDSWRPDGAGNPALAIVLLLIVSVGLPYLVLSASGPLLQHWFSLRSPGRSPYRLYALSNAGSLLGLLAYPFVVEPALGLARQTTLWSGLYVGYGFLCLLCAGTLLRTTRLQLGTLSSALSSAASGTARTLSRSQEVIGRNAASAPRPVLWLAFSGCGSAILLAVTNQVCLDVAVVPFLWVAPLSLYLLSFILCFESSRWYRRGFWLPVWGVSLTALVVLLLRDYSEAEWPLPVQVGIYFAALFSCCMICHGELARRKPLANQLTGFYLAVSAGGAAGGVFVNLVAPWLFQGYWELHAGLMAISLLLGWCVWLDRAAWVGWRRTAFAVGASAWTLALGAALGWHISLQRSNSVEVTRNFYGVLNVYEYAQGTDHHRRELYHGRIMHGLQYLAPGRRHLPTTYYDSDSGAGVAILMHPRFESGTLKIGAVGLGVGTIATFGREGDEFRFYEINPAIERIAREQYSYLADTASAVAVVLGDARVSLERELREGEPQDFDVLLVDAFSGDAIPVHLLTREAFELYWSHLKPDGILAIHITNSFFDLADVVRTLAADSGRVAAPIRDEGDQFYGFGSHWVVISSNEKFLEHPAIESRVRDGWRTPLVHEVHWTDDHSNLLDVLSRSKGS